MDIKYIRRTGAYLLLIWVGWLVGEYPHIPSFTIGFIRHYQPPIDVCDKGVATTLLAFSITILFALWNNIWIRITMIFMTWGFINNFIDEMSGNASYLSLNEQIALIFALTTTSFLIWIHRRKSVTK